MNLSARDRDSAVGIDGLEQSGSRSLDSRIQTGLGVPVHIFRCNYMSTSPENAVRPSVCVCVLYLLYRLAPTVVERLSSA